ncbi:SMC-Scp complex subunit ScpB [Micromonospora sp. WMMD1082]|uniref:SMC-Scp complex subunit ScpB n=1 Tax=Micromonospora sp. WMMD1082 TaxID=3016104 RepID=UPI00241617FB|nr:SMC-Scp complex subunit ScpB [Micromonospora sp. WMMD1082]MDG4798383.1 SMC-Scp complex subunit ScpB [Micromonospora sp. WMMD1082]
MSNEDRRESLADQAATWIPPWQRPEPRDLGTNVPSEGQSRTKIPEPGQPADDAVEGGEAELGERGGQPDDAVAAPGGSSEGQEGDAADEAVADGPASDGLATDEAVPGEPATDGAGESAAGVGGRKRSAGRARGVPEPAPVLDDAELRGALEAILLVVDEPVSELILAQVIEQPAERVGPMLDEIAAGYAAAGHGFELRRAAGGWRLYTRPEYATYVERFVLDGQSVRLTQAALETLAVVAYKQPVTRSRISAIRGVNCDGVIRTLVSRGLVEECGTETESGAYLYRTTTMFLEKLGLNSLDDLPPLAPFLPDDVEELADATR